MNEPVIGNLQLPSVEVVLPQGYDLSSISDAQDWIPFHPDIMRFIGDFSKAIMRDHDARRFPEIISLAHWIRPKALLDLKAQHDRTQPRNTVSQARGIAMHFAPGNVDTIFLYSALLSILMGNRNIVRISQRDSPQITLLIEILNKLFLLDANSAIATRLFVVQYPHNDHITEALSNLCDLRIIWGGDASVKAIREFPLAPRARDITFPNRWSLAVLDSNFVLTASTDKLTQAATEFVNDAYWFGQMACSSPRLVLWRGSKDQSTKASAIFWEEVRKRAEKFADDISPVNFVNKLVAQDIAAIEGDITSIVPMPDNVTSVSKMFDLKAPNDDLCVGDGMFWDHTIENLEELCNVLDSRSQTIVSFGISTDEWRDLVTQHSAKIDRIVPLGQALQFGVVWDGFDLLAEFSRRVSIEV